MVASANPAANAETNAHRDHVGLLIDKALSKD
jgi:hypothetical protein